MLLLPTLAVTVRRLHDTGNSGWKLLVALIPVVGIIWLFKIMLAEGAFKTNRYGSNPRISRNIYDAKTKRKNAGITLMITATIVMIISIVFDWIVPMWTFSALHLTKTSFITLNMLSFTSILILLITGFIIWKGDKNGNFARKQKDTMILLIIATFISLVLSIYYSINNFTVNSLFHIVFNFSIALFAFSILFLSHNKKYVRYSAILTIIFSGLCLAGKIYTSLKMNNLHGIELISQLQYLCETFYILMPIAFIILTDAFFPNEEEDSIPVSAFLTIPSIKDYEKSQIGGKRKKNTNPVSAPVTYSPKNSVFIHQDGKSTKMWRIYKAFNKNDALAFLVQQHISRPSFYVAVETPEGNFLKDFKGIYQV